MAVPPTRLPELVVGDDGTKTAFAFRGVVLGCKDLVIRIAGNADVEFPVTGLLINSSDSRLTDARAANAIKTLTSKAISAAADPQANNALVFDGTDWHPVLIVLDSDSRLTNDRTANKIRTSAAHNIATDTPQTNYALVFDGTDWHPVLIVRDNDTRLTNERTANAIKTATAKSISTAADPNQADGLVYDGGVWKPIAVAWANDSRLSDDRTADAIRTNAEAAIATDAPAAGHVLAYVSSQWKSRLPAEYHSGFVSPTNTSSTSEVMMGVAGSITPTHKTRMLITACGTVSFAGTDNRGGLVSIRHGTGTAPSNGASPPGGSVQDAVGAFDKLSTTAQHGVPFGLSCVATGLTVGTTYWLDFGLYAYSENAIAIVSAKLSAIEV